MGRPTIADVAKAAGVSISTVDRVLNARSPVRRVTADQVLEAAESIGFYASGLIRQRMGRDLPEYKFGFLLQQSGRPLYEQLAKFITESASDCEFANIEAQIEFHNDLSPQNVAQHMLELGAQVDGLAVVAAEHPRITEAINSLNQSKIHTVSLISELSASCGVGYVGLDNHKAGRTAAWAFHHLCSQQGKIATLIGSHRYRSQEQNEMGFRSYFREKNLGFELLEPMISFENMQTAEELTRELIRKNPDLIGLFVSGGGISGVLTAIRDLDIGDQFVTICYELTDVTRAALLDGALDLVISHPLKQLANESIKALISARSNDSGNPPVRNILPFDIFTPENI